MNDNNSIEKLSVSLNVPRLALELYSTSFSLIQFIYIAIQYEDRRSLVNCLQKQNFLFRSDAVSEYQGVPSLCWNCQ